MYLNSSVTIYVNNVITQLANWKNRRLVLWWSALSLSLIPGREGGMSRPDRLQKGPHASRISWVDVVGRGMCRCVMDSKEENAVPSRRRLCSKDTLETVVVRCGGGSWPEADCGPSSTGQQWCTGFWSSQISSVPAGWCLQSRCDEWPSAGSICSGSETPHAPSSRSGPLPLPDRQEGVSEEGWSPAWLPDLPVCCQECAGIHWMWILEVLLMEER